MNILLDTHVLLWMSLNKQQKFSNNALSLINDHDNHCFMSIASVWEIAIKSALGKPDFDIDVNYFVQQVQLSSIYILPISVEHVVAVANLPLIHNDPFDRLLLVQAELEQFMLMTADTKLLKYDFKGLFDIRQ